MNPAVFDADGKVHCWNCGGSELRARRTALGRTVGIVSWIPIVIGSFLGASTPTSVSAPQRLKCLRCNEYNAMVRPPTRPAAAPAAGGPAPASWQPDPAGRHEARYWDGVTWSDLVADGGVTATDPLQPPPGSPGSS